jgi:hypothetical protein
VFDPQLHQPVKEAKIHFRKYFHASACNFAAIFEDSIPGVFVDAQF